MENIELTSKELYKAINLLHEDETYFYYVSSADKKNDWALVFGYGEGFEEPTLCGKVAYQSKNCLMQEYDIDWTMPYDEETGNVDDTEIAIGDATDIEWLFEQWERIKKEENI